MLQAQMRSKKFMLSAEVAELIMEMRGNSIGMMKRASAFTG